MASPITNHVQQALARLMQQYKGFPNYEKLITALVQPVQEIENALDGIEPNTQLYNGTTYPSVGAQLDGIGEIVGCPRNGLSDAAYLVFILGTIIENFSDSTQDVIVSAWVDLFAPYYLILTNNPPAEQNAFIANPQLDSSLYLQAINIIQNAMGGGIKLGSVTLFDETHPFGFVDANDLSDTGPAPSFGFAGAPAYYGWGNNANGALSLGDTVSRSSPVLLVGADNLTSIYGSGNGTFCGLDVNGAAYAWGLNTYGELGHGDVVPRSSPVAVVGGNVFVNLAGSKTNMAGIDSNGQLWVWGDNSSGQCGQNSTSTSAYSSPVLVVGGIFWQQIALGNSFCLAMDVDGNLYSWGSNASGQLGLGDTVSRSTPTLVTTPKQFASIYASENFSGAIDVLGLAWMAGSNAFGQLGDLTTTNRSSFVEVVGPAIVFAPRFSKLSLGFSHCLGMNPFGEVYAWGDGTSYALGQTTNASKSSPVLVTAPANLIEIAANKHCSFAIDEFGNAYAWGTEQDGALGDGSGSAAGTKSTPTLVLGSTSFSTLVPGDSANGRALIGVSLTSLPTSGKLATLIYDIPPGSVAFEEKITTEGDDTIDTEDDEPIVT